MPLFLGSMGRTGSRPGKEPRYSPYVEISSLIVDQREILPAFLIEKELTRYDASLLELYKTAPTLAQLRHAFETNMEIKKNILANRHRGEWTATFVRNRKEAIERPDNIFFDEKRDLWITEGGKVTRVDLPWEGWVLEYDKLTGFPSRTGSYKEAEKIFGDEASYYFQNYKDNLYAIRRSFAIIVDNSSPFSIVAGWLNEYGSIVVGSRSMIQGSKESYHGMLSLAEEDERGRLSIATAKPGQVSLT